MNKTNSATAKDIEYYMALPHSILLIPPDPKHKDDKWFAEISDLDSCTAYADTREKTLNMIEDSKRLWIEVSLEHGDPIPEPTRR